MGTCCVIRDRSEGMTDCLPEELVGTTPGWPCVLHVQNGKKDYRLARVLRLMLEPRGKKLYLRETALVDLPQASMKIHPLLMYEDKLLTGEIAISQYVARMESWYPQTSNALLVYDLESLVAEVVDLWEQVSEDNEEAVVGLMTAIERRLGEDGAHFIGTKRSLADVYVYDFLKKCFVGAKQSSLPVRLVSFIQKFEGEQHELMKGQLQFAQAIERRPR